jgi:hypothetical protein
MDYDQNTVFIETQDCIFMEYPDSEKKKKDTQIGDPYTSALACIISRTTRNPIVIMKIDRDIENQKITTEMRLMN